MLLSFPVFGGILLLLISHTHGRSTPVVTINCQDSYLKVKGDNVIASKGRPTISGFMIVDYKTGHNSTDGFMTIEPVASGGYICMTRKGRVYHLSDKGKKKNLPHKNCRFQQKPANSSIIYRETYGIYSQPYSNQSVGLFLSFSEKGIVRGVQKSFDTINSKQDVWEKLELARTHQKTRDDALERTSFSQNAKYDSGVRRCIRRQTPGLFSPPPMTVAPQQSKVPKGRKAMKPLKEIIQKCIKRVGNRLGRKGENLATLAQADMKTNKVPTDDLRMKPGKEV
ncbi:Urease accessory protein UreD [Folsomia candida]|uniref:Urease accessory protein UreD n=1 Tax=Folsomia candida TaxID=158441 RepID=A0A226E5D6_FOLCA|nr:Urease accessory protein UreD [Folsomia candida]